LDASIKRLDRALPDPGCKTGQFDADEVSNLRAELNLLAVDRDIELIASKR
jgi:hypothetical protein